MSHLCCEVVWCVTNFSCSWHKKNQRITSDDFTIDTNKTTWFLHLSPKGDANGDNIGLYLHRKKDRWNNSEIKVYYQFSILDDKGFSLFDSGKTEQTFTDYRKCFGSGAFVKFVNQAEFANQTDKYFPADTFYIRCQIFTEDEEEPPGSFKRINLKTIIPVNQHYFDFCINTFSSLTLTNNCSKSIIIVHEGKCTTFTLSYLSHEKDKYIKVNISGDADVNFSSWKCIIKNPITKENFLIVHEDLLQLPYEKLFQPLILRKTILQNSQKYLYHDSLVLSCNLSLILNKEVKLPAITCNMSQYPSILYNIMNEKCNKPTFCFEPDKQSVCNLKKDISRMYSDGLMSDFKVQVGNREFLVHSFILASRSTVFYKMLETNMKEKQDKVLKLDDLEENVVEKLIDYLYTEDLKEMTVDLALKLYGAGHMYDILGLKEDLAAFLNTRIDVTNVCEIFKLCDQYDNEGLKSSAIQFVFYHERGVVLSKEFKALSKSNMQMCNDIFFKLSEMKMK